MPGPAAGTLPASDRDGVAAVYVPACINRIFGRPGRAPGLSLPEAMVEVSRRAGMPVWIPPDVVGHCCATPWASKGYRDGAGEAANRMVASMWRWSGEGSLPLVLDASSCAQGVIAPPSDTLSEVNAERHEKLDVLDSIEWLERLLPTLELNRRLSAVAVHPTCSTRHLGEARRLVAIAGEVADEVFVPPSATCCGFAGDRGLLHPELTAAATADAAGELAGRDFDAYLSSNRTCELGLERATGRPYESIVFAVEAASRA